MNNGKKQHPNIYVISLKRAGTRRAQMRKESERLKRSGYAGEIRFFDAVDAKAGEHKAFPNYSEFLANIFGAPLTDGERACFASHYLLWEKLAKEDKPDAACIIIEDDVEFAVDFQKAVRHCVDSSWECVRLAVIEDLSARRKNVGRGGGILYCKARRRRNSRLFSAQIRSRKIFAQRTTLDASRRPVHGPLLATRRRLRLPFSLCGRCRRNRERNRQDRHGQTHDFQATFHFTTVALSRSAGGQNPKARGEKKFLSNLLGQNQN